METVLDKTRRVRGECNKMAVIRTEHFEPCLFEGTPFVKMAIQDVNLSIEEGDGRCNPDTGSGKSTLIQHLNGLLKPTSGKIYIDGEDMWADKGKAARNPLLRLGWCSSIRISAV